MGIRIYFLLTEGVGLPSSIITGNGATEPRALVRPDGMTDLALYESRRENGNRSRLFMRSAPPNVPNIGRYIVRLGQISALSMSTDNLHSYRSQSFP
jgi:hypothetical protein